METVILDHPDALLLPLPFWFISEILPVFQVVLVILLFNLVHSPPSQRKACNPGCGSPHSARARGESVIIRVFFFFFFLGLFIIFGST